MFFLQLGWLALTSLEGKGTFEAKFSLLQRTLRLYKLLPTVYKLLPTVYDMEDCFALHVQSVNHLMQIVLLLMLAHINIPSTNGVILLLL